MSSINPTTNSQQEITTNNARLAAKHAHLTATLHDLRTQHAALVARARLPSGLDFPTDWSPEQKAAHALESARSVVKDHIALLHKYNEIRDIGQGLLGLVAERRGVRMVDVMGDFGVEEKD
ncbi:hypothetical protein M433DRAFT_4458 [Acidomyces richmondensis BFW]|nr:MAG: hypothetical protein FE78DRAFT_33355 [Acidomyces sp. 'richmondensis']KYG45594.1 hypothetical protein M433DRAFT_4458 [Acidomyces richmondensis BFW]